MGGGCTGLTLALLAGLWASYRGGKGRGEGAPGYASADETRAAPRQSGDAAASAALALTGSRCIEFHIDKLNSRNAKNSIAAAHHFFSIWKMNFHNEISAC